MENDIKPLITELTPEQKQQIFLEEFYRNEIKTELSNSQKKEKESKFWKIINSPFILLLISSGIISFFSWLYQDIKSNNDKEIRAELLDTKASAELSYRFDLIIKLANTDSGEVATNFKIAQAIFNGIEPYRPAIKEFENISILAIIYQTDLDLKKGNGPLNDLILKNTRALALDLLKLNIDSNWTNKNKRIYTEKIIENARTIKILSLKW